MQIRMLRELDAMFEGVPQTRKTLEVKEEMLQNLMEKYNDLLAEGKSEEAAFNIALSSIGDISDLIEELQQPVPKVASFPELDPLMEDDASEPARDPLYKQHHQALIVSVSVMLYILSPVAVILFGGKMGLLLLFAMVAAATGLLIYNGMTGQGKGRLSGQAAATQWAEEHPGEGDMPPEEMGKNNRKMSKEQKKFFASLSSALWLITVALYFVISFATGAWYITWIIFLIAAAANNVLKAFIDLYRQ